MASRALWLAPVLTVVAVLFLTGREAVSAETLGVVVHPIATSPAWETTPVLAMGSTGTAVVYTRQAVGAAGELGPGAIYVQWLRNGAYGPPVTLSDGFSDDELPDADGDRVVYTAFDPFSPGDGQVMLHDLSSGATDPVSAFGPVREARVSHGRVTWTGGLPGATFVSLWDVSWQGTGLLPITEAGPLPRRRTSTSG